jgi:predicted GH43/DUF377 family glycosyl hydrolase
MPQNVFVRIGNAPIFTPEKLPFKANAVFNPGAAIVDDEVLLLLRIEDMRGISRLHVARSKNGVDTWKIENEPLLCPDLPEYPFEEWGVEDARITQVEKNKWVIAYTAYSRYGPAVALAETEDFSCSKRLGVVLSPTNKDATIFPEQFGGEWLMLHRPVTGSEEDIWYATSSCDFMSWSRPGLLMPQRGGPWWDGRRIGVGAPPIKTDKGWLLIYHGVKEMGSNPFYRLGLALLDLNEPRKVIARSEEWVFAPESTYERDGLLPNVVFTCGAVVRGDNVWMYYGAADTFVGLAVARISDLLDFVFKHDYLQNIGHDKGMLR